jgi:hypothetical protein
LVDRGGETVDYAGHGNPYELRVAAAHFRIILDQAASQCTFANVQSFVVRAARASFFVRALPDGYALVVRMSRGAGFRGLTRAVPACTRLLADEAGWDSEPAFWRTADVIVDDRGRPRAIRLSGGAMSLEVLGRVRASLPQNERAWRVRVQTGVELTLVRESGGSWYADEWLGL